LNRPRFERLERFQPLKDPIALDQGCKCKKACMMTQTEEMIVLVELGTATLK